MNINFYCLNKSVIDRNNLVTSCSLDEKRKVVIVKNGCDPI